MTPTPRNPRSIIAHVDGSGAADTLATLTLSTTKSAAVLPPPWKFSAKLNDGALLDVNVVE